MKNRNFVLATVVLFWIVGLATAQDIQETTVKLSDHVYRVTLDYQLRPNTGVSIGQDGILLVDTGHAEVAPQLLTVVKSLGRGEVKYIINTHPHGDHAGGNNVCGTEAVIIRHAALNSLVSAGVLVRGDDQILEKPGRRLNEYYSMNFNGEELRIIPASGAHSDQDLIVWFRGSGVVHMGDLLLTQSFPAVGPRVKEYLEILDTAILVFPKDTKFIGGHGRDYTLDELKTYREMLQTTIHIVRNEMAEGKSLEEIQGAQVLKDWDSWGEFLTFLNPETWIESVFTSYSVKKSFYSDYEEMRKYLGELYSEKKYAEAADLLEMALDRFPDNILANTYNLSLMHLHLGNFEKSAEALHYGLQRGIFYSKYAFGGEVWAPLKETEGFKSFEKDNENLRQEAQKTTKPAMEIFKPDGFSEKKTYPLFIALHGGGGNIAGFKGNWTSSKLETEFITAYLQSSQVVAMDGYSWTEDIDLSKKEILDAYSKIVKEYPIDLQNVLIGGFSSGGVAALEVILDRTIPAHGFIILCPARPENFSADRIRQARETGVSGTLLTTEMDPRLPDQKAMAEMFESEDFPLQFIITPNIGHWFPEDLDKKIDRAIDFIRGREK